MSMTSANQRRVTEKNAPALPVLDHQQPIDVAWLRDLCLQAGADDVGFVPMNRPEIDTDRDDILQAAPWTKTLISFVVRMNRENIRSPMRSLANIEFHASDDQVTETSRMIVRALEKQGLRAMHTAFGFPMEADRWPGKMWVVSHKLVAEAAGLGKIGIHRNVIHPKFGSFIFLGTVLIDHDVTSSTTQAHQSRDRQAADIHSAGLEMPRSAPHGALHTVGVRSTAKSSHRIDVDPCLNCKLCVAACPTGAIKPDGAFDFSACYTHNYREFMGGFGDWVEQIADSKGAIDYRNKVSDSETVSMWQSLSFQSNYKAAYCLSVCPAGTDVIGPFQEDTNAFKREIVKPLTAKKETIYVVPDSDAESYVAKRFPHKKVKRVGSGLRPRSIDVFLSSLPHVFQSGRSDGLHATYHFSFTGTEHVDATVEIRDGTVAVHSVHVGKPDMHIRADAQTWLGFLAKEKSLVWALLTRRIRLKGPAKLLIAFGKCFPS